MKPEQSVETSLAYTLNTFGSKARLAQTAFGRLLKSVVPLWAVGTLVYAAGPAAGESLVGWETLPVPLGITNVVGIASGYDHSLALKADGTVAAWGTYFVQSQTNVPVTVPSGLSNVVAVAGGLDSSLALRADGTVVAWGNNEFGQLDVPPGLTNVVAIAVGRWQSLALKADGTVVGWGTYGVAVPSDLTNVVAIGAGGGGVALRDNGSVAVWGPWIWISTNVPPDLTNVVSVTGSWFGWLALKSNGIVIDPFGTGTAVLSGVTNVVAISGSSGMDGHQNLALRADGTVLGWGYQAFSGPVPSGLSNVVSVAAGGSHGLALVGTTAPVLEVPLRNPALGANGFSVPVPTRSGRVYRLEYKESLADSAWKPLPLVAGTGGRVTLTDTSTGTSQRFYRVRSW